jgi:Flp pilus assembly protein TadB
MIDVLAPRAAEAANDLGGLGGHGVAHQQALFVALAVLFAALVAALLLWFRRAARASQLEELDRLLDEE